MPASWRTLGGRLASRIRFRIRTFLYRVRSRKSPIGCGDKPPPATACAPSYAALHHHVSGCRGHPDESVHPALQCSPFEKSTLPQMFPPSDAAAPPHLRPNVPPLKGCQGMNVPTPMGSVQERGPRWRSWRVERRFPDRLMPGVFGVLLAVLEWAETCCRVISHFAQMQDFHPRVLFAFACCDPAGGFPRLGHLFPLRGSSILSMQPNDLLGEWR